MSVRKVDISAIIDALDRPLRMKGASFLFAQAPWLNILRYGLVVAGALAAGSQQYSKLAVPLIFGGVALFLVQSAPGMRGVLAGSLSTRLSRLRKQSDESGPANLDVATAAFDRFAATRARMRSATAGDKPRFTQYAFERFLLFWPLIVFAVLFWAWPPQPAFTDTIIAVAALAGLFVFGCLYYLALIYQHPGTPTHDSRVLAISAYRAQHLRQLAYFIIAATLWYAIAKMLPLIADENVRHWMALTFIIPAFATAFLAITLRDVPRFAAKDALRFDGRAPFLFLRSFRDEFVATPSAQLQSANFSRMMNLAIEMIVKDTLFGMGPYIAIADPRRDDDLRTIMIGAKRERLADANWQEVAAGWIRDAAAVIMIPGPTEGTQWELKEIATQGKLAKLILLFPFFRNGDDALVERYWRDSLAALAGSIAHDSLASIDVSGLRALTFQANGTTAIYCQEKTDTAYEVAFVMAFASTL
jgi:hypothetical protein